VIKPIHNGVKIVNKNAGGIILDGFYNLWKEKSLCDVKLVLKLSQKTIPVYRRTMT
jgi:hypothetical protein